MFLFLGLDACDWKLSEEFGYFENLPFELDCLKQDLPEVISDVGVSKEYTGWWTFYVWGAILSGQIRTPEMEQKHPTPNQVEFPDWKKNTLIWLRNRLQRKPQYDSFAWDDFEKVKIVNYPLHLPEVRKNCAFFSNDTKKTSREFSGELTKLGLEVNEAVKHGYDACFVVTRFLDCMCHSASDPRNHGYEDLDEWLKNSVDLDFEEFHNGGVEIRDLNPRESIYDRVGDDVDADKISNEILGVVQKSYKVLANELEQIWWDEIEDYMIVSDHGFNYLGAGSVKAHSPRAVFDSSFAHYYNMSQLITNWRNDLREVRENG